MRDATDRFITVAAIAMSLCGAVGQTARGQTSPSATGPSRTEAEAQARSDVDRHRKEAEQQTQKTLDADAVVAVRETHRAVQALDAGRADEALAAIERATGKINVLLARNPAAALIPVGAQVRVIDLAPTDVNAIKRLATAAAAAVYERDYPDARVLLEGLVSELRVRTYTLPLATYPVALHEAARLLDQKNTSQARTVLMTALDTLVIVDRSTPLPLILAQAAIDHAQAARDKDQNAARQFLTIARDELERARHLGYAGKDPEYDALKASITDVEKQLRGKENTESAFSKLKEKVAAFFKRHSENEKRSDGPDNKK